jgi:hypothetical protein
MVRRLYLNTPDGVHKIAGRHIDDVEYIAKKHTRCANYPPDLSITLHYEDAQTKNCCDTRKTETGKTGADDNDIVDIAL